MARVTCMRIRPPPSGITLSLFRLLLFRSFSSCVAPSPPPPVSPTCGSNGNLLFCADCSNVWGGGGQDTLCIGGGGGAQDSLCVPLYSTF